MLVVKGSYMNRRKPASRITCTSEHTHWPVLFPGEATMDVLQKYLRWYPKRKIESYVELEDVDFPAKRMVAIYGQVSIREKNVEITEWKNTSILIKKLWSVLREK